MWFQRIGFRNRPTFESTEFVKPICKTWGLELYHQYQQKKKRQASQVLFSQTHMFHYIGSQESKRLLCLSLSKWKRSWFWGGVLMRIIKWRNFLVWFWFWFLGDWSKREVKSMKDRVNRHWVWCSLFFEIKNFCDVGIWKLLLLQISEPL